MNYGIYTAKLSIGYTNACQEIEWDVREDYSDEEWNLMDDNEQDEILREWMDDVFSNYIEMSYQEKR